MSEEMKYFYLKNHPMLSSLTETKLHDAASLCKIRTVYRGEMISYGEGGYTRIHFLVKGKVKITDATSNTETELIKDILTEPDIFGDLGLEGKLINDECAEALTANTIICSFHVSDFRRILEENTKDRLIRFIKNWARSDGNRVGDKIVLNNYLTHSDIAGFIATSRQSVNMLLNELRTSGLLCYNRKHIELNNPIAWN
jgi:CRP/FNR family transcriptional regulator, cyclic AMP receptor protein